MSRFIHGTSHTFRVLICAYVALLSLCLAGCGAAQMQEVKEDQATLKDVSFVFRLDSDAWSSGELFHKDCGYLILVKEDGSAQAVDVGMMDPDQLVWNKDGLYLGARNDEVLLDEEGLHRYPRGGQPEYRTIARYSHPDGHGCIAYCNTGVQREQHEYLQRVMSLRDGAVSLNNTWGIYTTVGQVGDELYAITDTCWLPADLKTEAQVRYEETGKREVEGAIPDTLGTLSVLVKIYPQPNNKPEIVAAVKGDECVSLANRELQLYQGKIYCPTFMRTNPLARIEEGKNPKEGIPILVVWDLATGEKSYLPLKDNQGNPLPMVDDDDSLMQGQLDGSTYHFVTHSGRVYVVDLETGIGRHLFDIPLPSKEEYGLPASKYVIHGDYVYALNVREPTKGDSFAEIFRYQIETGEEELICKVTGLHPFTKNFGIGNYPDQLVINPAWLEQHK